MTAADLLGLPKLGRIAPNCVADMVVVQGDPISDISTLENDVVLVMKSGKIVRNDLGVTASQCC